MLIFAVALWNSTLAIVLPKTRAKPIQTPKTPSCIYSFWDKKVMREFLRKKIWGNFYNFKTIKAGVSPCADKTVIWRNYEIGICQAGLDNKTDDIQLRLGVVCFCAFKSWKSLFSALWCVVLRVTYPSSSVHVIGIKNANASRTWNIFMNNSSNIL